MDDFAHIEDYNSINGIKEDILTIKKDLTTVLSILESIQQKLESDDARKRNQYIRRKVPFPFHPEQYTAYLQNLEKEK